MKDFRWPWLWVGLWSAAVVVVIVMSLGSPPPSPDITNIDKVQHLLVYGVLAAGAVQVFSPGRVLLAVALALVALGFGLEVLQGTLTADRMMDWRDGLANALGVLLGAATVLLVPVRDLVLRWDRRTEAENFSS